MYLTVKTTKENRQSTLAAINTLGDMSDKWEDGSFDFDPYDDECYEKACEILDDLNIDVVSR